MHSSTLGPGVEGSHAHLHTLPGLLCTVFKLRCTECLQCGSAVDGDPVPVPHWGLALRVDQFHDLAARVKAGGIAFEIEPHLRFKGARLGTFV